MKKSAGATWSMVAALAVAACNGGVPLESAAGTTSGSGGSPSTTSSTGGSGGGCSVSLPAGCGCPDDPAGVWAHVFSPVEADHGMVVIGLGTLPVAPDGSMVLPVELLAPIPNSEGFTIASTGLVKLDARGQLLWDRPQPPAALVRYPTPDPRDCSTIVTSGMSNGLASLFGETLHCNSATCPIVARLDAAGSPVWIKVYDFGNADPPDLHIVGVLADGRIAVAGLISGGLDTAGSLDLGNGPLTAPPFPSAGIFTALLSPGGDALWSRSFTVEQMNDFIVSAVVSPDGDISVAVSPDGPVDFGDGPLPAPGASVPGGLALASYDSTGALRFGKLITTSAGTTWPNLARDSQGHLIVAERLGETVDLGAGPVGYGATLVAAFDGDGQLLWSQGLDSGDGSGLAVGPDDHIWVGFAPGVVTELDPGGALVAMHPIGESGNREVGAIGFTPGGAPVFSGVFDGTLQLGGGTFAAKSKEDAFVGVLAK